MVYCATNLGTSLIACDLTKQYVCLLVYSAFVLSLWFCLHGLGQRWRKGHKHSRPLRHPASLFLLESSVRFTQYTLTQCCSCSSCQKEDVALRQVSFFALLHPPSARLTCKLTCTQCHSDIRLSCHSDIRSSCDEKPKR
jgi:hypothetical protein